MERKILDFLNYAEHADSLDNEEYWKAKRRATRKAKEFAEKKTYAEFFKKETYEGKSFLNAALSKGLLLLPRLLLDYLHANPRAARNDIAGRTSLHYVCEAGHYVFLKEFINMRRYQIEYNAKDNTGLIPLHLAILNGHTKTAYKMLKKVAVVENHDLFFGRSIHAAAYMNQVSVINRIYAKFPDEVSIVISGFCSHVCALYGDSVDCLKYLWLASPVMPDKIVSKAVAYTESEDTALDTVVFLLGNMADANGFDELPTVLSTFIGVVFFFVM